MSDGTSELLDRFFAAIERGDIDAVAPMYAPSVEVWHNVTGDAIDKTASLDLLRFWCSRVTDMHYEVLEREVFPGGAVQRHVVHGRARDEEIHAQICIVFHVADGLVTQIFEYLDPAAVSAVFGGR